MMTTGTPLPSGYMLQEYRIDEVLGAGAFGITYRGWDTNLKAAVAIKEFFPSDLVSRDGSNVHIKSGEDADLYQFGLDAFVSEAQILAQFKHPNIVRVSRYLTTNKTAYFVMDYEEGCSLSELLRQENNGLDEARLKKLIVPILEGLKSVHNKKYLHRDIKPGNIYIRRDGTPLLIDFGAARLEFGSTGQDGICALTPGFAPIEQYGEGMPQGPWSDLYAIGATLYRCVTGVTPVDAVARLEAVQQGLADPLPSAVKAAYGRFTPEFLQLIDWAMAIRQENRPHSAAQLLERFNVVVASSAAAPAISFAYKPRRAVRNHKILFAGPVGAGKSTAVAALSDTQVVGTEQAASDMTRAKKAQTTVAMDYGIMKLSDDERVHLYGTPGQERFDFMWDILQKGALGLVILIDNSRKSPLSDLEFYLEQFGDLIAKTKVVIGVNFMGADSTLTLEDYYRFLRDEKRVRRLNPPIFEVDARSKSDMVMLIQALLYSIDPGVQDYNV